MQILDLLARTGGLESMARELGAEPHLVAQAAGALAPAVLDGLQRCAQAEPGGLMDFLGRLGGSGLVYEVLAPAPTHVGLGNEVLQQIFGSPEVSRAVVGHAAQLTGIDPALLARMLPMLVMMVAGTMAMGHVGSLGLLLGGANQAVNGLGFLRTLLDANGDGNVLDDIVRLCGGAAGRDEPPYECRRAPRSRFIPPCGRQRLSVRAAGY